MVLGVKIQNRETKEFMKKGRGWNKTGKVWSRLRDAKLAICPIDYYVSAYELNSDFIIINDDGTIEKEPVALYFIDYLTREMKHYYNPEKIQKQIDVIKKYCEENNIELGKDDE